MINSDRLKKKSAISMTWFFYLVIMLEMIYMATPFAVFFYSIYKFPLKILNSNPETSWLLQTVLPHFVKTNSFLIDFLMLISWPLILIGALVFALSFVQVYWYKFKKKGVVTSGFYRWIRHPQYVGWIVFGLGMCLLWSRLIVWIMYVTMVFIYYFLARSEEKRCLAKFPLTYKPYYDNTSMFFGVNTKGIKKKFPLPQSSSLRKFSFVVLYFVVVSVTVLVGLLLRGYSINQFAVHYSETHFTIPTIPLSSALVERALTIVDNDNNASGVIDSAFSKVDDKKLIYILPEDWSVSELGIEVGSNESTQCHGDPFLRANTHGNRNHKNNFKKLKLLYSKALIDEDSYNKDIFWNAKGHKPQCLISVDMDKEVVLSVIDMSSFSVYDNIPVPLF